VDVTFLLALEVSVVIPAQGYLIIIYTSMFSERFEGILPLDVFTSHGVTQNYFFTSLSIKPAICLDHGRDGESKQGGRDSPA